MRTLTITCSDDLAKTIVQLLLDEKAVFSISTADAPKTTDGNSTHKAKRRGRQKLSFKNRGLCTILEVGVARQDFTVRDIEVEIEKKGLSPKSASPALSHAVKSGVVLRDGKRHWLSEQGREMAKKLA